MSLSAIGEPLMVIVLLFGGTYLNRTPANSPTLTPSSSYTELKRDDSIKSAEAGLVEEGNDNDVWRIREMGIFGWRRAVHTPDTHRFQDRFFSRVLRRFPFLFEVLYWALIYWIYQLGRAFTAVTLVQGTVHTARRHALQLIHLEQYLHIFWEPAIQHWFMQFPTLMSWINMIYSFIHIPGTILFLVLLYYYCVTTNRVSPPRLDTRGSPTRAPSGSPSGPDLYASRRRTMGLSNLLAFIVFTAWPCMPPRLLSDPTYNGPSANEARSYGFVDTVHGAGGQSSVWTSNKFCNQFAAMPSLHFGYSLLVGMTVVTLPLASRHQGKRVSVSFLGCRGSVYVPSVIRAVCVFLGLAYPTIILIAIVSTANHFILDAVAGAMVCAIAWKGNGVLLNFVPLEDWFLWCLRAHKAEVHAFNTVQKHEGMRPSGKAVVLD